MRKILKPLTSGNHSAASGDTKASTAAGTSPLTSRSIALVGLSLSWASAAPAAAIAARTLVLDADCLSSIAMSLLARSDTAFFLIPGVTGDVPIAVELRRADVAGMNVTRPS